MQKRVVFPIILIALLLALTLTATAASPLADNLSIPWWTVDGGGGTSQGGGYTLSGTIGQADAGTASGDGYSLASGFWALTWIQLQTYLPVVSK